MSVLGARASRPAAGRRILPALACGLLAAFLATARACEAGPIEAIAGWEGDSFDQGYGFGTLGLLVADGRKVSMPVRATGSYLYYEFEDAGGTVRVRAPGVAAVAGPRFAWPRGAITLTGGGEVRWERREGPGGAGYGPARALGGAVFEGTADLRLGRRVLPFLLATYSGSARYLFGRASLRYQCSNLDWSGPATWNAGIEGTGQGNAETKAVQAGGLVECTLTRIHLTVGVHGGYKSIDSGGGSRRSGGYGGLSLYRRF